MFNDKSKINSGNLFSLIYAGITTILFFIILYSLHIDWVREFSIYTTSVFFEAIGFVLIGCLVGSLIERFLKDGIILKLSGRNRIAGFFLSALAGIIFPVCECAIVPVVRSLIKKGMPPALGITFLLSVPIANPVVGISTYFAFNGSWKAAGLRMLAGYIISVIIGLTADLFLGKTILKTAVASCCIHSEHSHEDHSHEGCGCCHNSSAEPAYDEDRSFFHSLFKLLDHTWNEFFHIAPYFILGICAASLTRCLFNFQVFQELFNHEGASSVFMMAGAFALNLCSEADAFVAASFRSLVPGTAIFAFLVYGPMMDLKLLAMYQSLFSKRTSIFLFSAVTLLTALSAFLLSMFHGGDFFGL